MWKCLNGDAAATLAALAAAADLISAAEELSELGLLRELTKLVSVLIVSQSLMTQVIEDYTTDL